MNFMEIDLQSRIPPQSITLTSGCLIQKCIIIYKHGRDGGDGGDGGGEVDQGGYPPSDLECLSRQDSENIAHC